MNQAIQRVASSLEQAGINQSEYKTKTLFIRELTNRHIGRLHALGSLKATDELPGQTGQCLGQNPAVLCLRPSEWLAIAEDASSNESFESLVRLTQQDQMTWNDFSDGLAVFRLSRKAAPWLLNKVSGLDYQAGLQSEEHCARTRIGHMTVTVHFHRTNEGAGTFDLIFDRSMARYLWELLIASSAHADELALAYGEAA